MAIISKVTIGLGRKVSIDYQSEDCSLIVSWELEKTDTDLVEFVEKHGQEIEHAHQVLKDVIKEEKQKRKNGQSNSFKPREPHRNYYPKKEAAGATEKQIQTALNLQNQVGITDMTEEALANLTKREISDYIGDLMRQKKEAASPVGVR